MASVRIITYMVWFFMLSFNASNGQQSDPDHLTIITPKASKSYKYVLLTLDQPWLTFSVSSCQIANVLLSVSPTSTSNISYEVAIKKSSVTFRRGVGGPVLKTEDVNGLLRCNTFKDFWISWMEDSLRIGRGREPGIPVLLEYHEDSLTEPKAVSISASSASGATWRFYKHIGWDMFVTSRKDNKRRLWFTETQRHHVVFGVKAAQMAKLVLSSAEEEEKDVHLIILGYDDNKRTVIKKNFGSKLDHSVDTPGILSKSETRYFWISWNNKTIQVGRGLKTGSQKFLQWKPDKEHPINAVGLYGNGKAEWHMRSVDENDIVLKTQLGSKQEVQIDKSTFLHFRAKASGQSRIEFILRNSYDNLTRIFIDMKCGVKEGTRLYVMAKDGRVDEVAKASNDSLLQCYVFSPFWLSWKEGVIQLGKNNGEDKIMMTWKSQLKDFQPEGLILSANESDITYWQFASNFGNGIMFNTLSSLWHTQAWLMAGERSTIVFKVKACGGTSVLLGSYMMLPRESVYEVLIQDAQNISCIHKGGKIFSSVETPGILDCNIMKTFWISWDQGIIEVGTGQTVGVTPFLHYKDTKEVYEINAISFFAYTKALWEINTFEGSYQSILITPEFSYPSSYWTTTREEKFEFSILGTDNAILLLSTYPDHETDTIEISIGEEDNTRTRITNNKNKVTKDGYTPGILDINTSTMFWLTWSGKKIRLGRKHSEEVLVELKFDQPFPLRFITPKTISTFASFWHFPYVTGRTTRLFPEHTSWYGVRLVDQDYYMFGVKAFTDAEILLYSTFKNDSSTRLKISIGKHKNTLTSISRLDDDNNEYLLKEEKTVKILKGTGKISPFWIIWGRGHLELGYGASKGIHRIIQWSDDDFIGVHNLGFEKSHTAEEWEFPGYTAEIYHVKTSVLDEEPSWFEVKEKMFRFQVTAYSSPLGLYIEDKDGKIFHVIIGNEGNQKVSIYEWDRGTGGDKILRASETHHDILKDGYQHKFWISWYDGLFKIGEMDRVKQILLEWYWPEGDFNHHRVGIASDGQKAANWELEQSLVTVFQTRTENAFDIDGFWMTPSSEYVSFNLLTCGVVSVTLTDVLEWAEFKNLFVSINTTEGLSITLTEDGAFLAEGHYREGFNCSKWYKFGISWLDNQVQVGINNNAGTSTTIVSGVRKGETYIKYALMGSLEGSGLWRTSRKPGDTYMIRTSNGSSLTALGLRPGQAEFNFAVTSCNSVHILLTENIRNSSAASYEISLGVAKNGGKEHYIIDKRTGQVLSLNNKEPNLIRCNVERMMSIFWTYKGIDVYEERIGYVMSSVASVDLPMTMATIASDGCEEALWEISRSEVEFSTVKTNGGSLGYGIFSTDIAGQKKVIFTVKSCGSLSLIISPSGPATDPGSFEIKIQDEEGYTVLRQGMSGNEIKKVYHPGLLHCEVFTTFHIAWDKEEFKFGKGIYPDTESVIKIPVNRDSVFKKLWIKSSNGSAQDELTFYPNAGDMYRHTSLNGSSFGQEWLNVNRDHVTFRVRGCANAHILLSAFPNLNHDESMIISIGNWENSRVSIRYLNNPVEVAWASVVKPLNCKEYRRFWISWEDKLIEVGPGLLYEKPYVKFKIEDDSPVFKYVSTQMDEYTGHWEFDQHESFGCENGFDIIKFASEGLASGCPQLSRLVGHTLADCITLACLQGANVINYKEGLCHILLCETVDELQITNKKGGYDVFTLSQVADTYIVNNPPPGIGNIRWIDVLGKEEVRFRVQACNSVHLLLALSPGQADSFGYEVLLGNNYTTVWSGASKSGSPLVNISSNDLLTCTQEREFRMTWMGGQLFVGVERQLDGSTMTKKDVVLTVGINKDDIINGIGIYSELDEKSTWKFGNLKHDPQRPRVWEEFLIQTNEIIDEALAQPEISWRMPQTYFSFGVMTCSKAKITLSQVPGDATHDAFEILIANGTSYIMDLDTGAKEDTQIPGLLDCCRTSLFWIQWNSDFVKLGAGRYGESDIGLIELEVKRSPFEINWVAVYSEGEKALWTIATETGYAFDVTTNASRRAVDLALASGNEVSFSVKACEEAAVYLIEKDGREVQEVVLGAEGNSQSLIRDLSTGDILDRQETDDLLDCDAFKDFSMRWRPGYIEIGKTQLVSSHVFLSANVPNLPEITNGISIKTQNTNMDGMWRFYDLPGGVFHIKTPADDKTGHVWLLSQDHKVDFALKTCRSGTIVLGPEPESYSMVKDAYVVTIGGGTSLAFSSIKRLTDVEPKVLLDIPGLVSCDQFNHFWISWFDGKIRVGRGTTMGTDFMHWKDKRPLKIGSVSFTSSNQTTKAEWRFSKDQGDETKLKIIPDESWDDRWLTVSGEDHVVFGAESGASLHIYMAEHHKLIQGAYEVILGRKLNTESVIMDGVMGMVKDTYTSPAFTKNSYQWYWISWKDKQLSVGQSEYVGLNQILKWNMSDSSQVHPVNSLCFRISDIFGESEAKLRFSSSPPPESFEIISNVDDSEYDDIWLIWKPGYFKFQIQSPCRGPFRVLLTSLPGNATNKVYELKLDIQDKLTVELVRRVLPGYEFSLGRDSFKSSLISCYNYGDFWLSVDGSKPTIIQFGRGREVGEEVMVDAEDFASPFTLNAISVKGAGSQWKFQPNQVLSASFSAKRGCNQPVMYRPASTNTLRFEVKAKEETRIRLYDQDHVTLSYDMVLKPEQEEIVLFRKGIQVAWVDYDSPVAANRYKKYWVKWSDQRVAIGSGHEVEMHVILSYGETDPLHVAIIHMCSPSGQSTWRFPSYKPDTFYIQSRPSVSMKADLQVQSPVLRFSITGCETAVLVLREFPGDTTFWQLEIGTKGNTISQISYMQDITSEVTPDILKCHGSTDFILTWTGYHIVLRHDDSGPEIIHIFSNKTLKFHAISIRSLGRPVTWAIPHPQVESLYYIDDGKGSDSYPDMRYTLNQDFVAIEVSTRNGSSYFFTEAPGVTTSGYKVTIQKREILMEEIATGKYKRKSLVEDFYEVNTQTPIWFSWAHDYLQVGKGILPDVHPICSIKRDYLLDISSLSVSSIDSISAWHFGSIVGNKYVLSSTKSGVKGTQATIIPREYKVKISVKACMDASLVLTTGSSRAMGKEYTLTFGAANNSRSQISSKGVVIDYAEGRGLLNCHVSLPYIIHLDGPEIGITREGEDAFKPFLRVNTEGQIHSIHIIDSPSQPEWQTNFMEDHMLEFTTNQDDKIGSHWLTMGQVDSMVFRVRACSAAIIFFGKRVAVNLDLSSALIIGDEDKRIMLLDLENGTMLAMANITSILTCDIFTTFWLRWGSTYWEFGKGSDKGENILLSYTSGLPDMEVFTFGNEYDSSGSDTATWQFFRLKGNTMLEVSPNTHDYSRLRFTPRDPSNFLLPFSIKACADVHVAYFTEDVKDGKFEVILGSYDNDKSEIRQNSEIRAWADTPRILSPLINLPFWVSWGAMNGTTNIRAGKGEAYTDIFLTHVNKDVEMEISDVAIGTWFNCEGEWDIDMQQLQTISLKTNGAEREGPQSAKLVLLDRNFLKIDVTTRESARISLRNTLLEGSDEMGYDIYLGEGGDTYQIRQNGTNLTYTKRKGLISEARPHRFWISWKDKALNVGSGEDIDGERILHWGTLSQLDFTIVSFTTKEGNTVYYSVILNDKDVNKSSTLPPSTSSEDTTSAISTTISAPTSSIRTTSTPTTLTSTTSKSTPSSARSTTTKSTPSSTRSTTTKSTPSSARSTTASTSPSISTPTTKTTQISTSTPTPESTSTTTERTTSPTMKSTYSSSPTSLSTTSTQRSSSTDGPKTPSTTKKYISTTAGENDKDDLADGPDVGLILIIVFGSLTVLIAASILIYLILQRNGPRHRFFFRYDRGETAFILSDMEEVNTN